MALPEMPDIHPKTVITIYHTSINPLAAMLGDSSLKICKLQRRTVRFLTMMNNFLTI